MAKIPKLYREDSEHKIPRKFLSDEAYADAIAALIVVCTDAAIISKKRKTIFLAKRSTKPMSGWWFIGGRRIVGETADESIRRCFARETSLDLPETRFQFVAINDYVWKEREQKPQDAETHTLGYTFLVELSDEEVKKTSSALDLKEYERGFGLQEFDRQKLIDEGVHQAVIDIYDEIFLS